jgi:hypothetical protein
MANTKPTAQTGALTLVLLVKFYRSQMIALLVKNGIVVNNNATDQQISSMMANLLKVSKSYFKDLNDFISNPTVVQRLGGGIQQTVEYSNMSGSAYMNYEGEDNPDGTDTPTNSDPALPTPTGSTSSTSATTPPKAGFFSNLNLADLIKGGMNLFGNYTKAQSDAEIARQHAIVAQAQAGGGAVTIDPTTGQATTTTSNDKTKDTKMSTTTIVLLSLVGVAVLGAVIYFATKAKK